MSKVFSVILNRRRRPVRGGPILIPMWQAMGKTIDEALTKSISLFCGGLGSIEEANV